MCCNINCDLFCFVVSNTSFHWLYNGRKKQSGLSQHWTMNHVDAMQNEINNLPVELL